MPRYCDGVLAERPRPGQESDDAQRDASSQEARAGVQGQPLRVLALNDIPKVNLFPEVSQGSPSRQGVVGKQ